MPKTSTTSRSIVEKSPYRRSGPGKTPGFYLNSGLIRCSRPNAHSPLPYAFRPHGRLFENGRTCINADGVDVKSMDHWIALNATKWMNCLAPAEKRVRGLLKYMATGETQGDALLESIDEGVKEFNMDPEKVRYAMSNDDLDARERAEELIEAKESAVAARDSIFGKVISALLSSGRQEDVAELGSNPSLVERYAQELGIEF